MDLSKATMTCGYCEGTFQALDENGEFDSNATINMVIVHREQCTEETPYTNDPNAVYGIG